MNMKALGSGRTAASSGRLKKSLEHLRNDSDSLPSPSELERFSAFTAKDLSVPTPQPSGALTDSDLVRLKAENRNLKRLQEVIHFLASADDIDTLVPELVGLATAVSGLSRGLLALLGSKSPNGDRSFKVRVARGITREERATDEVRALRRILARSLEEKKAFFEGDVRRSDLITTDAAGDSRELERYQLGAVVSLPLEANGELLGAILLDEPSRHTSFSKHETDLLQSFARHAALAILRLSDKKRLSNRSQRLRTEREELRKKFEETQQELVAVKTRSGRMPVAPLSGIGSSASASGRIASASGRIPRDRLEEYLSRSYQSAKRSFLRRYLTEAIDRAEGDLERAAKATGLSVSRLVKLLEIHQVQPTRRSPIASSFEREA
jgi:transcriptional regulator with GAF, ATPase, and Fis domain